MADEADITFERMEAELQLILLNRTNSAPSNQSLEECVDCGNSIPKARQELVKGCTTCVICQTRREKNKKLYA